MDVSLGMIRITREPVVDVGNLSCDLFDERDFDGATSG